MGHGRPVWSARATFAVVLGLVLASGAAWAQDDGGFLSAFELLASGPELGGSDIPRDVPARRKAGASVVPPEVMARVLTEEGPRPVPTASAEESGPVVAPEDASAASRMAPEGGRVSEPRVRLTDSAPRPPFKALPVAVAVVPGLVLHGLGAWSAGDPVTARGLFAAEAIGLGLIGAGLVPIALTGASRKTIGPLYAVTLTGAGVFSLSMLANLYAVTSPAFDPGQVPDTLPPLEFDLGYQYVHDATAEYRNFFALGAVARLSAVRLEASARLAPDEGNTLIRAGAAYRLWGAPERRPGLGDGTSLDVEGFATYHRYPTEGFTLGGGEVALKGRYAMARFGPRFSGSFVEGGLGLSFQGYSYPGRVSDDNLHTQLLYTFGYGVWLGRGGPLRGEAVLYYDHRKDGLVGGLRGRGGGMIGSFGVRGRVLLTERWGVAAEAQAGGALMGRLALVYAVGGDT
ncbi:hypothetical protein [Corallococcus aberystwythensis]|uniref:Uncharacterized protein n=1 Tax=Corallococcus aberystwythensis TaxID=2316722 RepID=A0A3A8PK13_9BACT|nr:hypothetical protein [Corallococcus aberystwythensis]RKH56618.1 hypothetical protein D7W81_33365 [Corallococcus aberystwythensis]